MRLFGSPAGYITLGRSRTVQSIAVRQVAVDQSGRLVVRPQDADASFQYVYRAGAGVRWDNDAQAFVAAEPSRWGHAELAAHIVRVLREECGVSLHLTPQSEWANLTQQQQAELRSAFEGGANAA